MKNSLLTFLTIAFLSTISIGQNCLNGFAYKTPIIVNNPNGTDLINFQVKITFDSQTLISNSKMQANGEDIRFASNCCDVFCHYLESGINTTNTDVWVKIPFLPANGNETIYLVYGNNSALSSSNADCTFDFHEGFDSTNFKFGNPCGNPTASTSSGNLDLSWASSGVLESDISLSMDTVYTAEMMVNSASGNWPAIYWGRDLNPKLYGMMINSTQARISVSGGGTTNCSGHNWASTLQNYSSVVGLWSITWIATGQQTGEFPTIGTINATDATWPRNENLRILIGGISSGSGSLNIDWIRARKYAAATPVFTIGTEEASLFDFYPAVSLGNDTSICSGDSVTFDATSIYETYSWSTNDTAQAITVGTANTYSVQVADSVGCLSSDTIDLTVNPLPTVDLGTDTAFCEGGSVTLDAGSAASYNWSTTETTQTIVANATNNYSVEITDSAGCKNQDTVTVTVHALPIVGFNGDSTICNGDSITLDAGSYTSFLWWDNTTSQTNTYSPSNNDTTVYSVMVTDTNGCTNTDSIIVYTVECIGINELGEEITVTYFPNPTSGILNINLNGTYSKTVITLLNTSGQVVFTESFNAYGYHSETLNLSGHAKGNYFLSVSGTDYQTTKQIIVE